MKSRFDEFLKSTRVPVLGLRFLFAYDATAVLSVLSSAALLLYKELNVESFLPLIAFILSVPTFRF